MSIRLASPLMLLAAAAVMLSIPRSVAAQHQHDMAHMTAAAEDGIAIPETREASGTSWQPDDSPMYAVHRDAGGWKVMFHGNAFGQFLYESGEIHRRGTQAGSINWGMVMATRPVGPGRLGLRGMVSLEPWTIGGCGYPNLLATGEVCDGDSIHDRQHPHDLSMEVAAEYSAPLTAAARWQVYVGSPGEPALGPTAFPHRLSAFANPISPMAHHWLDATHISFGVVTGGVYTSAWKAEMSVFNGREPDERRTNIEIRPLDSVSARFSVAPTRRIVGQVSVGHLTAAEGGVGTQPRTDVNRFPSSVTYHHPLATSGVWATPSRTERTPAAIWSLVSLCTAPRRRSCWSRPRHGATATRYSGGSRLPASPLTICTRTSSQAGCSRSRNCRPDTCANWRRWHGWVPGVGGSLSLSMLPPLLAPRYGGRVAPGFGVFVNIRPAAMAMEHVH